jgi:PKD repeat protein
LLNQIMLKNRIYLIVILCLEFLLFPFKALSQEANPLPYAANWESGSNNRLEGFSPGWQMDMIEKGHCLLLQFGYNYRFGDWFVESYLDEYFRDPIEKASNYGIPLGFKTTQPESMLFGDPWISLPPEENPNAVENDGTVQDKVSPCGPVEHWRTVGECWVNPHLLVNYGYTPSDWWSNPLLSRFQDWYPDPPFVIWLSNNEAGDLDLEDVDEDYRFQNAYSGDPNYDSWQFRNEIIGGNTELTNPGAGGYGTGHGYIPRYNAMFDGMRDKLHEWADKIKFVGYIHDPLCFGRWDGWVQYIPAPIPGRFSTIPFTWDGSSTSYYVNGWQYNSDYTGFSPQLESMNLPFQRDYYRQVKGDFWWEISTWFDPVYVDRIRNQGQEVPPERYGAFVKWCMWLTRPRAVRDFKYSTETRAESWQWYEAIVDAVDEIHVNPTLERFWKYSEPVLLTDIPHPWQHRDEFWPELFYNSNERARWYQLPNILTYEPTSGDDYSTIHSRIFNVWIMANVMGTFPEREWLIYANSPLEAEMDVTAILPGYGTINLTAERGGTYYLVRESGSNEYIETEPSVRAAELDDIELEWGEQYKFNAINSSAYKCDITDYSWDFGDGTTSDNIAANHSFARPGIYEVRLTVTSNIGRTDVSTMNVSVGVIAGQLPVHVFPNPFNPDNEITNIRYSISQAANVTIKIYDTGNNLVKKVIDNEPQETIDGYYDIPWDGKNGKGAVVANGVYFVIVESLAGESGIGKICVIR